MFRRRAKQSDPGSETVPDTEQEAPGPAPDEPDEAAITDTSSGPATDALGKPVRRNGPWDVSEVDGSHPSHQVERIDLGGLRVRSGPGIKVQVQVDKATGLATSVLLGVGQAFVQLRATAAPKTKTRWPQLSDQIAVETARQGGSTNEGTGPWGPVLRRTLPVKTPDGKAGVLPSIVLGIDGPRWLLEATLLGRATVDQQQMNQMIGLVQDTVVVRGDHPMAPGELIELTPPPPGTMPAPPTDQTGPDGEDEPEGPTA